MKRIHSSNDAPQTCNEQRADWPGLTRAERHALSRSTPLTPAEFRALGRGTGHRAGASRAR